MRLRRFVIFIVVRVSILLILLVILLVILHTIQINPLLIPRTGNYPFLICRNAPCTLSLLPPAPSLTPVPHGPPGSHPPYTTVRVTVQ